MADSYSSLMKVLLDIGAVDTHLQSLAVDLVASKIQLQVLIRDCGSLAMPSSAPKAISDIISDAEEAMSAIENAQKQLVFASEAGEKYTQKFGVSAGLPGYAKVRDVEAAQRTIPRVPVSASDPTTR